MTAYGYIHQRHFDNGMAVSRLDLLHALVLHGTFCIDDYVKNTNDRTIANGHYYCDKAPGTVVAALPSFFLSSKLLDIVGIPAEAQRGWLLSSWVCTAASVGLITSIGMACLFLWLQGYMPRRYALASCVVIGFGSMAFPYATMLMSHAMVVGLFSIALYCLRLGWDDPTVRIPSENKKLRSRDLVAGAACGIAIASEYSAALVAAGILAVITFFSWKRAANIILGAIPPLLLILVYNWVCVGNPFSLTYSHEDVFTENERGFYGIHWPNVNNLFALLFNPRHGLFFWTPFLLLVYVGYPALYRVSQPIFWLCYLVPLIHVLVMSGYYTVTAGDMLGERLLAPILPLLILPAGIGARQIPWIALLLGVVSIVMMGTATLIDAKLPPKLDGSFVNFYITQFVAGSFTHNIGEAVGLRGFWSILPLILVVLAGVWYLWRQCDPVRGEPELPCRLAADAGKAQDGDASRSNR
jgi:hypothetical protein